MKLRELLTKINDAVRPPHVKAESGFDRVIDDGVDAHQSVPVGLASQQDEEPRH